MERQDMANVLQALFTKGMEINLEDESFEIIKIDSDEKICCKHFTDWINIFIDEGNIEEKDVEKVKNFLSIENMKKLKGMDYINYHRFAGVELGGEKIFINVSAILIPSVKENIVLLGIIPTGGFIED